MISLNTYIENELAYQNSINRNSKRLLNKFKISLSLWNCFESGIPKIFEQYEFNFDNCYKVIDKIIKYLCNESNIKSQDKIFDCSDYDVFFKKLKVTFVVSNTIGGFSEKSNDNETINISLKILDKSFEDYDLKENKHLRYIILHELTHNFVNYIKISKGEASMFDELLGNYGKEYLKSYNWLSSAEGLRKEIVRCRYFLDDNEMKAYLGTIEETVKNIANKIKPNYKDLKYDEILELFGEEFIWKEYVAIDVFIKNIDNVNKNALANYYRATYGNWIDPNKLIKEFKEKWEYFTKEVEIAFIEGYSEYEKKMTLECEITPTFLYNKIKL